MSDGPEAGQRGDAGADRLGAALASEDSRHADRDRGERRFPGRGRPGEQQPLGAQRPPGPRWPCRGGRSTRRPPRRTAAAPRSGACPPRPPRPASSRSRGPVRRASRRAATRPRERPARGPRARRRVGLGVAASSRLGARSSSPANHAASPAASKRRPPVGVGRATAGPSARRQRPPPRRRRGPPTVRHSPGARAPPSSSGPRRRCAEVPGAPVEVAAPAGRQHTQPCSRRRDVGWRRGVDRRPGERVVELDPVGLEPHQPRHLGRLERAQGQPVRRGTPAPPPQVAARDGRDLQHLRALRRRAGAARRPKASATTVGSGTGASPRPRARRWARGRARRRPTGCRWSARRTWPALAREGGGRRRPDQRHGALGVEAVPPRGPAAPPRSAVDVLAAAGGGQHEHRVGQQPPAGERQRLGRRLGRAGGRRRRPARAGAVLAPPVPARAPRPPTANRSTRPPSRSASATPRACACGAGSRSRSAGGPQQLGQPANGTSPLGLGPGRPQQLDPVPPTPRTPAARLADAGLAGEHEHPAAPEPGAGDHRVDGVPLGVPPDEHGPVLRTCDR